MTGYRLRMVSHRGKEEKGENKTKVNVYSERKQTFSYMKNSGNYEVTRSQYKVRVIEGDRTSLRQPPFPSDVPVISVLRPQGRNGDGEYSTLEGSAEGRHERDEIRRTHITPS